MRILGLDYGEKRIGIAISGPEGTVAFPRDILKNTSLEAVLEHLRPLIKAEKISTIVVGWPLSLKGSQTNQTNETQDFINDLKNADLSVKIEKMDERWTTAQANRTEGDDSVAAQIILQTYLDMVK